MRSMVEGAFLLRKETPSTGNPGEDTMGDVPLNVGRRAL